MNKNDKLKTYIIGHKNPDTDSIVSAIAYAELKRRLGFDNVRPARAGILNQQTAYILQQLKIKAPVIISDIRTRICEVMIEDAVSVKANEPLKNAFAKFEKCGIRYLPVLDDEQKPIGLLTLSITTMNFLKILNGSKLVVSLDSVKNVIDGKIICDIENSDNSEKEYEIIAASGSMETFKNALKKNRKIPKIIVADDRYDLLNTCCYYNVKMILLSTDCDNQIKLKNITTEARKKNIIIISTQTDISNIILNLKQCTAVKHIYSTDYQILLATKALDEARRLIEKNNLKGIIAVDENGRLAGVVTRSTFMKSNNKQIILVDHNEPTQAIDGINEVEIIEIVDHHRISTFQTIKPITFINFPVGSTSTIVAMQYKNFDVTPDKKIAQLLIAGILSDTIILKSPTTTQIDKNMIKWLNSIAQINYKNFAAEFFRAGSVINAKKLNETINSDFKTFEMAGNKVGIGQIEAVGLTEILKLKGKIIEQLRSIYTQNNYNFVGLLITDITEQTSIFAVITNDRTKKNMPWREIEENIFELKGILSRKKQVVPALIRMYNS